MIQIKHCPACGSKKIKKVTKDWRGKFQNLSYRVPHLNYYECPNCHEKIYDRQAMQQIESFSPAFQKHTLHKKSA